MPDKTIAAIILAAGQSSRFAGGAKLVADFDGKPLSRWAADAARGSKAKAIVAVTGHFREKVESAMGAEDLRFVHNPHYMEGVASSLRAGLAALPPEIDGALICLADMPRVSSSLLDSLIEAFAKAPADVVAVVPTCGGVSGNPALLSRAIFPSVARLQGDEGARRILRAAQAPVLHVETADSAILFDVDKDVDLA